MHTFSFLLPDPTSLHLNCLVVDQANSQVSLTVSSSQAAAQCPLCTCLSHRIHSCYQRRLKDLPYTDYCVAIGLNVKKFFCDNTQCQRRIFTERLSKVAQPWARQTNRAALQLIAVGLAVGGKPGASLVEKLHLTASRNTLLKLVRQLPLPQIQSPRVIGVDDFCFRKRKTYGTILIDHERRRPIALLPDREAATLTNWLKDHPGVDIVTRDRSEAYKKGISNGAPAAVQVADRFHLLQNLTETLDQVFNAHQALLKTINEESWKTTDQAHKQTITAPVLPSPPTPKQDRLSHERRERRVQTYGQVWELHRAGWSAPAIAHQLGIGRTTVFRHLRSEAFPERRERSDRGQRNLAIPYNSYLLERWNTGCQEVKQLFQEIKSQGYTGSYDTLARYMRRFRRAQGLPIRPRSYSIRSLPKTRGIRRLTPRSATWLVLRPVDKRKAADEKMIAALKMKSASLAAAIELAESFAALVRELRAGELDAWLLRAEANDLQAFKNFARSLRADYEAVTAGMSLSWSNGATEGHINRLKMIKRQMFGRAHLDLLSRRFICRL